MRAVIIANGEGEALKPLTCTKQEAALQLFGKPILLGILGKLKELNPKKTTIVTGVRASDILALFPDEEYGTPNIENIITENIRETLSSLDFSKDTTILVFGNCVFNVNLPEALAYHIKNNNDVTYIENGEGLYIFEPTVSDAVFEGKYTDISSELLPLLFDSGLKIGAYKGDGFCKIISDISSYKRIHFDILDMPELFSLPKVADGFYCEGSVPSGEYIAVPPLWLGENVQIEQGAVIGPFAVISGGSLISKGAKVRESILLENTYVSSKASICGAVLGEGVSVKHSASVLENAVIGADTIIGEGAVIEPDVKIWPKKTVPDGETVSENIKYAAVKSYSFKISSVIAGDFGVELTPEKTARLGASLGTLFENVKIGVGIDGEANSVALKCGLLGGLISTGAKSFDFGKCYYSQMFYFSLFCDLDFAVFVSGGKDGAAVYMCEKGGIPLRKAHLRRLEQIMLQNEFNRCSGGDCRNVNVLNGMEQMYEAEVLRKISCDKNNKIEASVFSSNELIINCVTKCIKKAGGLSESENLIFKINKDGTSLSAIENNNLFSFEKILAAISYNEMLLGNDIALPWDAPEIITTLAENVGRHIYRYGDTHDSHSSVFLLGAKQLWSRDAVFLLFKALSFMNEKGKTLCELIGELPEFYVAKKIIEIDSSPSDISNRLLKADFSKSDYDNVIFKNNVRVKADSSQKTLKIIAEAVSLEMANELCDDTAELIAPVGIDKDEE